MKHGVGAIAALSVAGMTMIAALMLPITFPAASQESIAAADNHTDAAPICSTASDGSESTFYSEMAQVNAHMHEGMEVASSGDIDRDFMRMMIAHHQGAIDMAVVLLKYGRDEKLKRLAQSIIVEQRQEITYMRTLLEPPRAKASDTRHAAEQ
jgi:uncharacterized protein (DUF305 family)